jgi:hypothetical protein
MEVETMNRKMMWVVAGMIAMGMASGALAATNVYSKNAVGYMTLSVTSEFTLATAQFDASGGGRVTVGAVFVDVPRNTELFFWDPLKPGYNAYAFDGTSWLNEDDWSDASTNTIPRGVGFWIRCPPPVSTNLTVLGEVPGSGSAATSTVNLSAGFTLVAYPYPVPRSLSQTTIGQNAQNNDELFIWRGSGYSTYAFSGGSWADEDTWEAADPVLSPGQGFWYKSGTAKAVQEGKPYNWP